MSAFRLTRGGSRILLAAQQSTAFSSWTIPAKTPSSPLPGVHLKSVRTNTLLKRMGQVSMIQKDLKLFSSEAASSSPLSKEHFDKLVKNNKIVVFMKGVPEEPRCGFSNAVVQILRMHGVDKYDSHNVLEDEQIRQGIKEYTNWPTIPQVFIDGEFVGGCDILIEMHKNGELVESLKKVGIKSALSTE